MSSIVLSRHGPVDLPAPRFPSRAEFAVYVDAYADAGIRQECAPPKELMRRVRDAGAVFANGTRRTAESLELLDPERTPIVDPIFAEEPQRAPNLSGRWPLLVWFALARGLESFHPEAADVRAAMRQRACEASTLLIAASERGAVVLVGHGWFNRAIARALSRKGWRRVETQGGSGTLGSVAAPWGHVRFELRQGA